MLNNPVYLDYNATTPVAEEVLKAMLPYFTAKFGNAASKTHAYGWIASEAVDYARAQVAELICCSPDEVIFTSGATEAVNLAIKGVVDAYKQKGNHIIVVETEHKCVLDTVEYLESKGILVSRLSVSKEGLIDLDELEKQITEKTILIAVMAANNETGTLQPVDAVGRLAHEKGVLFLCDATQLAGKSRIEVNEMQADLLCLSAHKIYGPKGVGALYHRRKNPKVKLIPLIHGGGHENGMRSGTLNVAAIVGFGEACKLAQASWWNDAMRLSKLRTTFEQQLIDLGGIFINGSVKYRLPNTSNLLIKGVQISSLIRELPELAFSTGSACSSADPSPSHVLLAMGLSPDDANSSARFTLGKYTTDEEITFAIGKVKEAIVSLRQ